MKKLFSFLGVNRYVPSHYKNGEFTSHFTRFTTTAIYEWLNFQGIAIDEVVIFLTDQAEKMNWMTSVDESGTSRIGLIETWSVQFPNDIGKLRKKKAPDGQTEEEQWELFELLYEEIREEDEIYFDITHGFRSFPIMALLIGNYVNTVKNARVSGLYYGNFESLGPAKYVEENIPEDKRLAPIVDMTPMLRLFDWSIGISAFLNTGNPKQIIELTKKQLSTDHQNPELRLLRDVGNRLLEMSMAIETNRGKMVDSKIDNVKRNLERAKKSLTGTQLRPFVKLLDRIEEKILPFTDDTILNILSVVRWCAEHGLYQQAYTILQEGIITATCYLLGRPADALDVRLSVSQAINFVFKNKYATDEVNVEPNNEIVLHIEPYKDYLKAWQRLTEYRNDFNHNGMRETSVQNPKVLIDALPKLIEEVEPYFIKVTQILKERGRSSD